MLLYIDRYQGLNTTDTHIMTSWYVHNTDQDALNKTNTIWSNVNNTVDLYGIQTPNFTDVKYARTTMKFRRTDNSTYDIDTPVKTVTPFPVSPDIFESPIHAPRLLTVADDLARSSHRLTLTFDEPYPKSNILKHLTVYVKVSGVYKARKQVTGKTVSFTANEIFKNETEKGTVDIVAYYTNTNNVVSEPFEIRVSSLAFSYTGLRLISTEEKTFLPFTVVPDNITLVSDYDIVHIENGMIQPNTLQDGVTYFIEATHGADTITVPIKTTSLNATRTPNPNALTHFEVVDSDIHFKDAVGLVEQLPNGNYYCYTGQFILTYDYAGTLIKTTINQQTNVSADNYRTIAVTPSKLFVNASGGSQHTSTIVGIEIVNNVPTITSFDTPNVTNGRGTSPQVSRYGLYYSERHIYNLQQSIVLNLDDSQYSNLLTSNDKIHYIFQPNASTIVIALTTIILVFDVGTLKIKAILRKHFNLDSNTYCTLADGRCVVFDVPHGELEVLDIVAETITQRSIAYGSAILRHTNDTFTILDDFSK